VQDVLTENFLRGRRRQEMSAEENAALEAAMGEVRPVAARQTLIRRGERVYQSTLLLSGVMCRYMDDRQGERQLVAVHFAGDFVDLHGFPLRHLDHDLAALSACRVVSVPHDRLTQLTEAHPHLGRLMWFSTLIDAAMHREWIFRLGRLAADGRIAHLLCESHARLAAVGLVQDGRFDWPLTQQDMAEACGLTSVHVNRTLAKLRASGLVTVANRQATIHDFAGLALVGEFEPDYLYLEDEAKG